mgnify:CR=1 FL=1
MTFRNLVEKSRTCRRFDEKTPISREVLTELISLARLTPSAGNLQPLKYILSSTPEKNMKIFPHLRWAAYLPDWAGPAEGEKPAAYIIILGDTFITKNFGCDHGIAAQTIMLGAVEKGISGCMFGSIDRPALRSALDIPEQFEILLVIALGMPKEKVVIEPVGENGNIKYWRDKDEIHHVPKRSIEDLILKI